MTCEYLSRQEYTTAGPKDLEKMYVRLGLGVGGAEDRSLPDSESWHWRLRAVSTS
jgi:hypothetical protein